MKRATYIAVALVLVGWVVCVWGVSRRALTYYANTGDESSVVFQAEIFAGFAATAPTPPLKQLFPSHYVEIKHGRWYSQYPPLGPLLLVPGVWLGSIPLWMAVISAAGLVATWMAARRSGLSAAGAWGATLVLAVSPTYLFHSASYYTHVPALLFITAALAVVFGRDVALSAKGAAVVGALLGAAAAVRPFTTACVAPWFVLHVCCSQGMPLLRRLRLAAVLTLAFCAVAALIPLEAYLATGHPFDLPYGRAGNNAARFGTEDLAGVWARFSDLYGDGLRWLFPLGAFPGHTPKAHVAGDLVFHWVPGLIAVGGLMWRLVRGPRRWDAALMVMMVLGLSIAHSTYAQSGGRFGARFMFEAYPVIVIAFMWGLSALTSRGRGRIVAIAVVVGMVLWSALWIDPATTAYFRDSNQRRFIPYRLAEEQGITSAIIEVQSAPDFDPSFYTRNQPDLSGNLWVVYGRADQNAELHRLFPTRPVYVFRGSAAKNDWRLERVEDR